MKYYFKRFEYRRLQTISLIFDINVKRTVSYPISQKLKDLRARKTVVLRSALIVALKKSTRSVSKVFKGFEIVAAMNQHPPSKLGHGNDEKDKTVGGAIGGSTTTTTTKSTVDGGVRNVPSQMITTSAPSQRLDHQRLDQRLDERLDLRRSSFEPVPLDTSYESHPFFDRFHNYMQHNSVYDIWRPSQEEHHFLQENNPIVCPPPAAYHRQFNSAGRTTFWPEGEQTWNSSASPTHHQQAHHYGSQRFETPSSPALRPDGPHRPTSFWSAAATVEAWHSPSPMPPPPSFDSPSSSPAAGGGFRPPSNPSFLPSQFPPPWMNQEGFHHFNNFQRGRGNHGNLGGLHRSSSSSNNQSFASPQQENPPSSLPNSRSNSIARGRGHGRRSGGYPRNPTVFDAVVGSCKNEPPKSKKR